VASQEIIIFLIIIRAMFPPQIFLSSLLLLSAFLAGPLHADQSLAPRERASFNTDWLFQKNDPAGIGDQLDYLKTPEVKAAIIASSTNGLTAEQKNFGVTVASTQPEFNDSAWRKLDLPHDWAIEGPFDINLSGGTGKLPFVGVGWYRKHFTIPASDAGKQISLELDGAMSYPMVWCNGVFVGGWPYGYSSSHFDLTPYLKIGGENVITIRTQTYDKSSRWYPGAGIYRNVWLTKTTPVHVAHWGTYITTPEIKADSATVNLKTIIQNESPKSVKATVATSVYALGSNDQAGEQAVATLPSATQTIAPSQSATVEASGSIPTPKLWSTTSPNRYVAFTTVSVSDKIVDRYETPFGIRTIKFTADNGFLLNGKRVPLNGVCNHHDLGALGAAFNLRAAERQLQMLQEMGCNALRTSHNPPAPELLDLCDKMGILVMDESFDCWKRGKRPNDYSRLWDDWHEKDLRAEYHRDRNHPSVIMWSIGNELMELGDGTSGPTIAAELTKIAGEEDPTRPTVLGANTGAASYNGIQKALGVMGQNYEAGGYAKFHASNPTIPLVASETASTVSSRGEYIFETEKQADQQYEKLLKEAQAKNQPIPPKPPFSPVMENPVRKAQGKTTGGGTENFQVSSYDLYGPGWTWTPDGEFKSQAENPFVAGEFVWTGFDYLGEPTPFNSDPTNLLNFHNAASKAAAEKELSEIAKHRTPSRSSYFGIIDLAGFKKDRFYLYQAHWRPDLPMAHILPHWNWPERVGQIIPVHVYTSGDEAELFLNGKSLGRKKKALTDYRLRWDAVVYQPGELKVIAYKDGQVWAQDVVKTTGPATQLLMKADRSTIAADGKDLSFVIVTVADKEGLLVPRSMNLIKFSISGPGEIVATDNGDATDLTTFSLPERKAFNGLALVIIKAKPGQSGPITVTAESDGLTSTSTTINGK